MSRAKLDRGIATEGGVIRLEQVAEVSRGHSSHASDEGPNGPPQGG
jgi:hypothetical protein